MSAKGDRGTGTSHACVACKHQRKKCGVDCALAPYFPPSSSEKFYNVRRLFGVSNTLKLLNSVDSDKKSKAMETIFFEAEARKNDPVYGCVGVIRNLSWQIDIHRKELEIAQRKLAYFRQREQVQLQNLMASSSSLPPLPPPLFSGCHYQPQLLISQSNEAYRDLPNLHAGSFDQRPPFEDFEDITSAADIKPFDQMMKPASIHIKDPKKSSTESTLKETRPLDHFLGEESTYVARVFTDANRMNKGRQRCVEFDAESRNLYS